MPVKKSEVLLAESTWQRYKSGLVRGHDNYQKQARRCEDFYLGGGRQWDDDIKTELEEEGRPWLEPNLVPAIINTVLGYQTQTRMDIAYKPRADGDRDLAELLSKLGMFVLDQNRFPWVESEVFSDGVIQQRGYFDIRLDFTENMNGEIKIISKDPMDIIPDPDAKTYDPDGWQDVIETRWMTIQEVRETYGRAKARRIEETMKWGEPDFGVGELGEERNKFADSEITVNAWTVDVTGEPRVRVLERQYWKIQMRDFWVDDETGDMTPVPDGTTKREMRRFARENGKTVIQKEQRRVRWTVTTSNVVLHDDWSPYDHFTIVPYFPYFRRGVTMGLVDNLISTQEMFNKVFSQILHIVNSSANSGWIVQENSLSNIDTDQLESIGAQTGLVLEYKAGRDKPEKIQPNQIPTGLESMADKAVGLMQTISGVSEAFQGRKSNEVSGAAIQSRVQQNAVQIAVPLDNLFKTRHILANRILELIQTFYTERRVLTITETNPETGEAEDMPVTINDYDEEMGEFFNDVTQGKYDVVVVDVPDQVTFQQAQFQQALELRKFGVNIPDDVMIEYSGLSKKNDLAKRLRGETNPEAKQAEMAQMQAEVDKLRNENDKLKAEVGKQQVETLKAATEISQMMVSDPALAPVVEAIMRQIEQKNVQEQAPQQALPNMPMGGPNNG